MDMVEFRLTMIMTLFEVIVLIVLFCGFGRLDDKKVITTPNKLSKIKERDMSNMQVTVRDIVKIAQECHGEVRAIDADGTHGALFVQLTHGESRHAKENRAYVGDWIIPVRDGFAVVKNDSEYHRNVLALV